MIVVSDSSPLVALAAVGRLDLLRRIYGRVLIPTAVQQEIARDESARAGAVEIGNAEWIEIVDVDDSASRERVGGVLGRGETQAMYVALTRHADLLIVDDLSARKRALTLGLRIVGLLGVLLEAKTRGHIAAVGPVIDEVLAAVEFRIDASLHQAVLHAAGEAPR